MALADWNFYNTTGGQLTLSINVLTPLVNVGSGRIGGNVSSANAFNLVVSNASGRAKGVTRGKLRSLFRYNDFFSSNRLGLMFLQSVENISGSGTGPNFYRANITGDGYLYLSKNTNGGIGNSHGTTLASVAFDPGINTIFSLEVEWIADIAELGGVAMFVRCGFATDYSDLTTVITYLDVFSPFTTSVAEGIGGYISSAINGYAVDIDQTTLFVP
jgi:hypothetical protein